MKKILAGLLLALSIITVNAQESKQNKETAVPQTENTGIEYRIHDVTYDSKGITKPFALSRNIEIDYSKTFSTEEELKTYIEYIIQQLENTRLLEDIDVSYELLAPSDGYIPVDLAITVSDSSHFLIMPKPSYDSNTGFELELKLKDNNFLGFMNPLSLGLNFDYVSDSSNDDERNFKFGLDFSYDFPFSIGITEDTWTNDFSLDWKVGNSAPDFSFSTGINAAIPFGRNHLIAGFTQSFTRKDSYKDFDDSFYFTEGFNLSLPLTIGRINDIIPVSYTPAFTVTFNWDGDGINPSNTSLLGPSMSIKQTLNISNVNWKNNFRDGYAFELYHYFSYNFNSTNFSPFLSLTVSAFKAFKYVGINFRAYGYGVLNDTQNNIGGKLRGIVDDQYFDDTSLGKPLESNFAVSFNLDVPIHIITTDWMGWGKALFGPYDELSPTMQKICWLPHKIFPYLDFELQLSPFIDIGLTKNEATGNTFDPKDSFVAAGFEVLVFPSRFKSYVVRGSLGVDVGRKMFSRFLNTDWRDMNVRAYEISIGLGLHF
ncbi:MAG: hypothetical protein IKQ43_04675 [Treponema sp.]|nr:hypothetical protein [Treponema sp.]